MIDRLRYDVGEDELTMTGLTAAIVVMRMREHRAVKAGSRDSVSLLWYEIIAFGTNSFNVQRLDSSTSYALAFCGGVASGELIHVTRI